MCVCCELLCKKLVLLIKTDYLLVFVSQAACMPIVDHYIEGINILVSVSPILWICFMLLAMFINMIYVCPTVGHHGAEGT